MRDGNKRNATYYDPATGIVGAGNIGLIEQPVDIDYTAKGGWISSRKWIGPARAAVAQAAALQVAHPTRTLKLSPKDAGLVELTMTQDALDEKDVPADPNGEPEVEADNWNLQGQDMEKSLFTHPEVTNLVNYTDWTTNAAGTAIKALDWLRLNLPIIEKAGTWVENYDAIPSTAAGGNLKPVFQLFMEGAESYTISQWVLSHSGTIASRAQGQFVHANVGKQLTGAQMGTLEGLPSALHFATPSGVWIKRTPSYTWEGSKLSFQIEYWHADTASEILYPSV